MKIAVIGSNGRLGRLIVEEAVNRNFLVTGVARNDNESLSDGFIQKDLFDLEKQDLSSYDVVVSAFGVWDEADLYKHRTSLIHLSDLLSNTDIRLIVVGGAGSLFVDEDKNKLSETPDFPDSFKLLAENMGEGLEVLRTRDDVNWTYISPAANFSYEIPKTGTYKLAGEYLTMNKNNESVIGYADYAVALVDEIDSGHHYRKRISVVSQ